ncbi:3-oxoacyl-[acyl-carrier protein] reductase [hydrothermal vent metagenome]|uniref:3-oxoacyl-[acyl-carrier protein] reductase n=1 Tax=hydrothermal vent metagenome TaxID=652676 RepID=A0A3B0TZL3_9ZZZZ
MDLSGKIALITGGSKGMGLSIAARFVADGASVMICSNDEASIIPALKKINAPSRAAASVADVTVLKDMQRLVAETCQRFGGLDILVNSAGIQTYGNVVDTPENVWDQVFAVNVKGIFLAAKFAIPEMEKRHGGSIINLASAQAYASQSNVAAYTATKGAILSLTRAMALDHADVGVRVNAICPAAIDTPMLRHSADLFKGENSVEQTLDLWGQAHPAGRVGTVEEIAAIAAFLASDECLFMTGADIKVDGGLLAKLGLVLP